MIHHAHVCTCSGNSVDGALEDLFGCNQEHIAGIFHESVVEAMCAVRYCGCSSRLEARLVSTLGATLKWLHRGTDTLDRSL